MSEAPLELWVRSGVDGVRNGADPVCQQLFMVLLLKGEDADVNGLRFNVKTVNPAKPHAEFKGAGLRHVPALVSNDDVYEHPDEILEFIDAKYPRPALQYFDPDAESATNDLFSKFCFYIKEVKKDPKGLEAELRRVDAFLRESETPFLTGTAMTHLDCRILPILQHIRVAAEALEGYRIPRDLNALWAYLQRAYASSTFTKSCPSDQEIILYWAEKHDTAKLPGAKMAELARQASTYSWSLPEQQ